MSTPSDNVLFIGGFHPLLIHLPIGFLVLLAVMELAALFPRWKNAAAGSGFIAALAVPAAGLSALCGWLLAEGGDYDAALLAWHRWTGIAVTVACTVVFALRVLNRMKLYRLTLFATVLLLAVASHFGGSLTRGSDYMTRHAPGFLRSLLGAQSKPASAKDSRPAADQPVFTSVIQPVFQKNCTSCHGPEKKKGGLRLDTLEAMRKGGENGPAFEPGKAAASHVVQRTHLPLSNEDHMPPEGKPQPTQDDLALIQWWIDAGAPSDKTLRELNPPDNIRRAIESKLGAPPTLATAAKTAKVKPKPLAEVLPVAEQLADELGISITALSPDEPWLQCNASLAGTNFGDTELAKLTPLAANLRWLDLAGTRLTDAGLELVGRMSNLMRLHLDRTGITDAGLTAVAGLHELEYLNLYGTAVTDAVLAKLKSLPKLRQVYLWQTAVTPEAAKVFAEARLDKEQVARWEEEVQRLQAQIKNQGTHVHLGAPAGAAPEPRPVAINTICPVSCKLADRTKTLWHEGKLVAFCCDDCKASFVKDPAPYLAKLTQFASVPPGALGLKPVNDKCPVSGKDVDPAQTAVYKGKVIAFCCEKCKATFETDPKPHLARLNLASAAPTPETKQ